jgi:hypothetical protein
VAAAAAAAAAGSGSSPCLATSRSGGTSQYISFEEMCCSFVRAACGGSLMDTEKGGV